MNDEENWSTIEKNEEEDDVLNDNIESTESEERGSSESQEHVSSHGRTVREKLWIRSRTPWNEFWWTII